MPFRDRLKKTFGGRKSADSSPGTATPVSISKPENAAQAKQKKQLEPENKERLHAFAFSDAFADTFGRRKSSISASGTLSPHATAASRRTSWVSRQKASTSGPASESDRDSKSLRRKSVMPDEVPENEVDDTDVGNAGLSRTQTARATQKAEESGENELERENTMTNGELDAAELGKKLTNLTLPNKDSAVAVQ